MIHIFVLFLFGATLGKFQREKKINMVGLSLPCLCLLEADEFPLKFGSSLQEKPLLSCHRTCEDLAGEQE